MLKKNDDSKALKIVVFIATFLGILFFIAGLVWHLGDVTDNENEALNSAFASSVYQTEQTGDGEDTLTADEPV